MCLQIAQLVIDVTYVRYTYGISQKKLLLKWVFISMWIGTHYMARKNVTKGTTRHVVYTRDMKQPSLSYNLLSAHSKYSVFGKMTANCFT